ncbi:MAG: hypothetical protein ACI4D9_01810 [Lachnospiraceae bacterium]
MEIFKKTALDDDASIYQKHKVKTEKEKWREMDRKQRLQYFTDYYLGKCVIGILGIAVVALLIWNFFGSNEEIVLHVAVIDESLDEDRMEQMEKELIQFLGVDDKYEKIIIDDSFYSKKDALNKLEVYLHSNQIDVIISDYKTYHQYAGYGFFQDINDVLGKSGETYQKDYVLAAGYKESEEISFEDKETGQGEEKPYGVDISKSRRFNDMKKYIKQPVFAIAQGTKHKEQAVRFLEYLMEKGE